ncbi:mitochondrial editing factor [Thalictrum thalictroides]|uniref:Mitochondrial editing factor n=1 Tax=Thalictrum thalictroides TaxID=46969 RepID=A0A7J6V464_THATH|nr:mitochondrial editing factor [Thalictrum thalictroides]
MIKGHFNTKNPAGALDMYKEMQRLGYSPDHFTFPFVLKACAAIVDVRVGKCVHNREPNATGAQCCSCYSLVLSFFMATVRNKPVIDSSKPLSPQATFRGPYISTGSHDIGPDQGGHCSSPFQVLQ